MCSDPNNFSLNAIQCFESELIIVVVVVVVVLPCTKERTRLADSVLPSLAAMWSALEREPSCSTLGESLVVTMYRGLDNTHSLNQQRERDRESCKIKKEDRYEKKLLFST